MDFGVGYSTQMDITHAGQEAAHQAMTQIGRQKPDLTLVFADVHYADPRLLKGIRGVTEGAPLVGCSDAGGIHTSTGLQRSVIVIVMRDAKGKFTLGCGRGLTKSPERAVQEFCTDLKSTPDARALFIFPDGLAGNSCEYLRSLVKEVGATVPILGGCAGDGAMFQKTFQFYNEEVLTDALSGVLLSGDMAIGMGTGHGWSPLGAEREVTKSEGRFLQELDRRPAITIYEEYLGMKRDELAEEAIANVSMMYPLGVLGSVPDRYVLRDAIRMDRKGGLVCTGELPEGSRVRLMIGRQEGALSAAHEAADKALKQIGDKHLKGALVFCGMARQRLLGGERDGEIDVIRDALGGAGVRMGGFYTFGEFAPLDQRVQFHNESVVVVALG